MIGSAQGDLDSQEEFGFRFNPYMQFIGSYVPDWLEKRRDVKPAVKLFYARLMRYAGKDGDAFPSHEDLATSLGISVSSSQKYVRELKDLGLIEARQRGLNTSNNFYFLRHPWMLETAPHPNADGWNTPARRARATKAGGPEPDDTANIRESEKRDLEEIQEEVIPSLSQGEERRQLSEPKELPVQRTNRLSISDIQRVLDSDDHDFPRYRSLKGSLTTPACSLGPASKSSLRAEVVSLLNALSVRADSEDWESRRLFFELQEKLFASEGTLIEAIAAAGSHWLEENSQKLSGKAESCP